MLLLHITFIEEIRSLYSFVSSFISTGRLKINKLANFIDKYAYDYLGDGTKEDLVKKLRNNDQIQDNCTFFIDIKRKNMCPVRLISSMRGHL